MRLKKLTGLAIVLAVFAIAPAAAQAATITFEGSTLVFSDQGGEVNDIIVTEGSSGYIRFYEYAGSPINVSDYRCGDVYGSIECQIPSAMRVVLGGGNDEFVLQGDFPRSMPVTMLGGDGNDILKDDYDLLGTSGRRFEGGAGNDVIEAYQGDDVLIGDAGNDKLKGGAGNDEVRGGDGDDELEGDKYEEPGADVIDGGAGFDIVEEWSDPEGNVHPAATVTQNGVADDGRPGEGDNVTGIEKITSHVNGTYEGTEGADDIWIWSNVGEGDSVVRGLGGDDKLKTEDYSENIDGGAGNDTIQAGLGNDTIVGGPGRDTINADGGSYCGGYECKVPFGDDTVDVRDGEVDTVECGIGNDTVKADPIDQIAPSCENVDRAGAATAGGGGDSAGGGNQVTAASVGFALVGKASTRKGLVFRVSCAGACQVTADLVYKGKKVGRGARTLIAAGKATVKVKLSAKGRKALKRAKKAKASLKVAIKDPSGQVATVSKAVTLKR